ncbi:hypothetical protein FGG08_003841 [Glutinoglossum americanum]|uniref:Uncharacterized protein n=1 Tax=Glutinoglossum americanum TaxID=1670608 RepID=A0A9P8I3H0_9PEZI|nr:hypothetical protein FGG08_003841 [Glutinoglossum americanum]
MSQGAAVFVGHYMFFRYLDRKSIDSFDQSLKSNINVAFTVCFRATLGISLSLAFTQRLWHTFRSKPLRASTIDYLFSILNNPRSLLTWDVIKCAKFEWLFALVCWSIPLATILPTGALIVVSDKDPSNVSIDMTVPGYNSSFRGDGYFDDLVNWQLGVLGADGDYKYPKRSLVRIANQVLFGGEIVAWPSPCGQNCTYSTTLTGPSFKCTEQSGSQYNISEFTTGSIPGEGNFVWQYYAANNKTSAVGESGARSFRLYLDCAHSNQNCTGTLYLDCAAHYAEYSLNVSYVNGTQAVAYQVRPLEELYYVAQLFNYSAVNNTKQEYIGDDYLMRYGGGNNISYLLPRINAVAIKDALVEGLSGNYSSEGIGEGAYVSKGFTILEWSFCRPSFTDPGAFTLSVDGDVLAELLNNVTISMIALGIPGWSTTAKVTLTPWINIYSFFSPRDVLIPYIGALSVSLFFIIMSLIALCKNGVTAADGFLQIVSTTRGSKTLDEVAAGSCLGGKHNFTKDLRDLKLVYGETTGSSELSGATRRAGFGTRDEVSPLKVGVSYGE